MKPLCLGNELLNCRLAKNMGALLLRGDVGWKENPSFGKMRPADSRYRIHRIIVHGPLAST